MPLSRGYLFASPPPASYQKIRVVAAGGRKTDGEYRSRYLHSPPLTSRLVRRTCSIRQDPKTGKEEETLGHQRLEFGHSEEVGGGLVRANNGPWISKKSRVEPSRAEGGSADRREPAGEILWDRDESPLLLQISKRNTVELYVNIS